MNIQWEMYIEANIFDTHQLGSYHPFKWFLGVLELPFGTVGELVSHMHESMFCNEVRFQS